MSSGMMAKYALATALALCLPARVSAQSSGLEAACGAVGEWGANTCSVVAQTVTSAQPQLGILLSGGNPTPGSATSGGGLRMGVAPRLSVGIKANLVHVRTSDQREMRVGPTDEQSYGDLTFVAPALSGVATIQLFEGFSTAPTIGGLGSIELLGMASWLPLEALASDDFRPGSSVLSYGGGVRVGLIRESFTAPGISVAILHHRLGNVAYGEICPVRLQTGTTAGDGYTLEQGECSPTDPGDLGEFRFDLQSWSGRATVSKHLLGLGLAAGIGYDRHASDIEAGFRTPQGGLTIPDPSYAIVRDVSLEQSRWSAFANGSYSLLVAALTAELGWMQGTDTMRGFPSSASDFDPGTGTFFGSVGLRVAL